MLQKSYICVTFVNAIENGRIMWYILITGCDIYFALIKSERMKGYVKKQRDNTNCISRFNYCTFNFSTALVFLC